MKNRVELATKRKFLPRIFGEEHDNELRQSSQVHILREDLHLGVMPVGGQSRNHEQFSVDIVGNDKDAAIQLLSEIERVNRRDIKERICDVVNELAQNLTYSGLLRYEINSTDDGYSLDYIPERSFYDLGFMGVQWVPKEQREHVNKLIIFGSSNRIWKITFPNKLHTRKQYMKILKDLSKYTNLIPQNIEQGDIYSKKVGFDMVFYNHESKKFIYRLLNTIGGAQRETRLECLTEYYLINRMIRLNLSRAILREHIINELNELFKRLKINAQITLSGLPTSKGIRVALTDLQTGKIGLDEALKNSAVY